MYFFRMQYLKQEDISEQQRLLQWQIDYRGSLLAVLLHHTIDHTQSPPTDHPPPKC